ncbi:MAG: hypothetical protein KDC98_11140, partial [Planctomycetes bacterium]|nr:hypothetical protein [Planctomycetota bacterium]
EQAALHLGDGVIRVKNLALADRSDLGRDLFAADELLLTIDTGELLRRRFVIDEIKAVKARSGTRRDTPGVVLPGAPEPEPEPGAEGVPTLEDYLEEFELWRQRLEQARQWLDVIYPDEEEAGLPQTAEEIEADRQRQLEQLGYAGVIASHLFGDEPSVLIRKIDIEGITWTHDGIQEQLALRLRDVSSDPALFGKAPSVELATASPTFALGFGGAEGGGSGIGMTLAMCGLSVDGLLSGVRIKGENPLRGGTLDFECRGSLQSPAGRGMTLDLPLALTLRDATFAVPGTGATQIAELALPLGLRGSVTNPSVFFELGSLRDALLAVGKNELARLVQDNVGKLIGDVSGKLPTELQGIIDPNKKPEEMVDAAVEAAKQKLADEAKKAQQKAQAELEAKAKKEAEKLLPGLGGLFGGKKKE